MLHPAQSDTEIYFNLPMQPEKKMRGNISTLQRKVSPFVFVSSLPWQQKLMMQSIFPAYTHTRGWLEASARAFAAAPSN
jgi:hypothetical protein